MTIPDGYKRNSVGHLVPIEQVSEIDQLRDELVTKMVKEATALAVQLAEFKEHLAADMVAFLNLSSERYGVAIGGMKGNVTLSSFDGKYKVVREVAERIEFDERLQAAKALIDQCLREWTKFAGSEVRALISDAFQVDKKGRINTQRILGLRKLEIDHPIWRQAMDAISDAITVTGSCTYYRIYERNKDGKERQLILDFSRA